MPCRDDFPPLRAEDFAEFYRHGGEAAELLCSLMKNIEASGVTESLIVPTKVALWWEQHKIRDAEKRRAEEAEHKKKELRKTALAKLSLEERQALGLI